MTESLYYGLVIITSLCTGMNENCMEYHSTFVQKEPFHSEDQVKNDKWCNDSKVFVEKDMEAVFPEYKVKSMECTFKVIPYLSKDMLDKLEGSDNEDVS